MWYIRTSDHFIAEFRRVKVFKAGKLSVEDDTGQSRYYASTLIVQICLGSKNFLKKILVRIIQSVIIRVLDSTARRSSGYNVYYNTAYTVTPM